MANPTIRGSSSFPFNTHATGAGNAMVRSRRAPSSVTSRTGIRATSGPSRRAASRSPSSTFWVTSTTTTASA